MSDKTSYSRRLFLRVAGLTVAATQLATIAPAGAVPGASNPKYDAGFRGVNSPTSGAA